MAVQTIRHKRSGRPSVYMDGFSYRRDKKNKNGSTRMRCSRRGCKASILLKADGGSVSKGHHNHIPSARTEKIKVTSNFKTILTTRAAKNVHHDLRKIYLEEKEK